MDDRIVSSPSQPLARALAVAVVAVVAGAVIGSSAIAQEPKAKPAPKAAPKAQPKAPPAAAPAPADPGQPGGEPQLTYSAWTKVCGKGQEAGAKQICITMKNGHLENGFPMVGAALIEAEGEAKKMLRVNLPTGVLLQPGTRVIVDAGQPLNAPYVICFNNVCISDYEASGELITKLKRGQGLVVQGVNGQGQPIQFGLPLQDFAKAYDGPPTDPKIVEEQQKKLGEELEKRARDAQKRLEGAK